MLVEFIRLQEVLPETPEYDWLRRQKRDPESHPYINLLDSAGEVVAWDPRSPDKRLYMLSQIQIELGKLDLIAKTLEQLDALNDGIISTFRLEGRAWDLAADKSGIEFTYSIMDGEPGGKVNIETYRATLEAWRRFLMDENCQNRLIEIKTNES